MLEGKNFIILSHDEAKLLYAYLAKTKSRATYKELGDAGILGIVEGIREALTGGEQ